MSDDIILEGARARLITVFETPHFRLVQQVWDEDGAGYALLHGDGTEVYVGRPGGEPELYDLDDGLALLIDLEADWVMDMGRTHGPDEPDEDIAF